jgi:hypothetical protein
MKYPHDVQGELFQRLVEEAHLTRFGVQYGFHDIKNYEQFRERVPIHTYEMMFPYIERLMRGEENILWPSAKEEKI